MSNGKTTSSVYKPEGIKNAYLALYLIGAVLSGAGGNYVWMRNVGPEILAPDRFTGAQGAILEARVGRIEDSVQYHLNTHPDKAEQYNRRITTLEAYYEGIKARLDKQDNKLDRILEELRKQ